MIRTLIFCLQIAVATNGQMQSPAGWTSQDIGNVGTRGSTQSNKDATNWIVHGGGADIFGVADSFHCAFRRLQGDGSITANVEGISKTDLWAKGGLMIRESLELGSRFAGVYATPDYGVCFQARIDTGGLAVADTTVRTEEQRSLTAPVWIRLERKGNQFRGYYATDGRGTAWTAMAWNPQTIPMPGTVYIGLAVTSHLRGCLCEADFRGVTVSGIEASIPDAELLANPGQALVRAYQELGQFGNWRANAAAIKDHGNLIASSLFTIARARGLRGEPLRTVLTDYYRITTALPDSWCAVDALACIAVLDGTQGLNYALERVKTRSKEDQDRFYIAVMKGCCQAPETPVRNAVIQSFVDYVGRNSAFTLIDDALADFKNDEPSMLACKNLIARSMAQPSNARAAVVALRHMALKSRIGEEDSQIQELAQWVTQQFTETQLTVCALAILADSQYSRGLLVEALETFRPGLFSGKQTEAKVVESIESILTCHRANTLLPGAIDLRRVYRTLSEKAIGLGLNVVALHCLRKTAEVEGLSLERFEKSAQKGLKCCESSPEDEVWFWKGLVAAEEGDLGQAAAAYERFVQHDSRSIFAARAYYDLARAKMAMGEDAKECVAKAKVLSPCESVLELERRLNISASQPGQE
jgi:hypothetical protein